MRLDYQSGRTGAAASLGFDGIGLDDYNKDMLLIQVEGQLEERLKRAAESTGDEPLAVARRLLEEHLPRPNDATIALLEQWDREDATDDPEELARRSKEGEEFMASLARNRRESEGSNARTLWP